jgi:hypothetical protein
MNVTDQLAEKKKIKMFGIIFLVCALLDFAFGIYALICFFVVSSKLVYVGDKLNQTGVDALIRMEKDSLSCPLVFQ